MTLTGEGAESRPGWHGPDEAGILHAAAPLELGVLGIHLGPVLAAAYSPDGSTLATGGYDGTTRLWNPTTGEQTHELTGHQGGVRAVAYSPDGSTLATGGDDGTTRLWNPTTGQQTHELTGHQRGVYAVAYSPDGSTLATGGYDGTTRLWNPTTGQQTHQLTGHQDRVLAVAYSPDGTTLATAGNDNTVRLWNPTTGQQTHQLTGHQRGVYAVAYSPDGSTLATAGDDSTVRLWNPTTGQQTHQLTGDQGRVLAVAYSPDGSTLATAGNDNTVRLWNPTTGQQTHQLTGHQDRVLAVAYSPDGSTLATAGDDSTIRLWNPTTGQQTHQLTGHQGQVNALTYSPDGSTLATAGTDGTIRLWNPTTGQQTHQLTGRPFPGGVLAVAYSPDGSTLATAGGDRTIRLWNPTTGQQTHQLTGHQGRVRAVGYSPDGSTLATAGTDGTIRLWNPTTGQQTHQLTGHRSGVTALAYSPDGSSLATADDDGTVRLWNPTTGPQTRELTGHQGGVLAVAYSPDGTTLATAGDDNTIRLWNPTTGQQTHQLTGHQRPVNAVAYSPDGSTLATAGNDGTVRLWDAGTGEALPVGGWPERVVLSQAGDVPSERDLLGIAADVERLAELIAASGTTPPLSIALLGPWGSGKSTFALQLRRQVERYREAGSSAGYVDAVEQIEFNAWHYGDDHVWPGIIEHLFSHLAGRASSNAGVDVAAARDERDRLRTDLTDRTARLRRLRARLDRAGREDARASALPGWSPIAVAHRGAAALRWFAADLRAGWRSLLGCLVAAAVAAGLWWRFGPELRTIGVAVIAAAPPSLWAVAKLGRAFVRAVGEADARTTGRLETRRDALAREVAAIESELARLDAISRLAAFTAGHSDGAGYERYRGVTSQVRDDLEQLSHHLAAAREQWAADRSAGRPAEPGERQPPERIVLYIEDLDRCPPRSVVDVLRAVHLLLGLDLFIVVVEVDARWLVRCLAAQQASLFPLPAQRDPAAHGPPPEAVALDYLDKIFQIPFGLKPMGPAAEGYLLDLLPPVAPEPAPASGTAREPAEPEGESPRRAPIDERSAPVGADGADRDDGRDRDDIGDRDDTGDRGEAGDRGDGGARRERNTRLGASPRPRPAPEPGGAPPPERLPPPRAPALRQRPALQMFDAAERAFLGRLHPLLGNPRAVKKFVGLYRLVRIGHRDDPDAFLSGPYQADAILLAVLTGHPTACPALFADLTDAEPDTKLVELLRRPDPTLGEHDRAVRRRLADLVDELCPVADQVGAYQARVGELSRYSFQAHLGERGQTGAGA